MLFCLAVQILFHFSESVFFGNNTVFEDGLQQVTWIILFLRSRQVVNVFQYAVFTFDHGNFTSQGFFQILVIGFRVLLDEGFLPINHSIGRLQCIAQRVTRVVAISKCSNNLLGTYHLKRPLKIIRLTTYDTYGSHRIFPRWIVLIGKHQIRMFSGYQ